MAVLTLTALLLGKETEDVSLDEGEAEGEGQAVSADDATRAAVPSSAP